MQIGKVGMEIMFPLLSELRKKLYSNFDTTSLELRSNFDSSSLKL